MSISQSNSQIMEYLISKLESRSKKMQKCKNFFSFEPTDLLGSSSRREALVLFDDVSEDLKQAAYAIKALLAENKALTLKLDRCEDRNYINEITQINNQLVAENENLKIQIGNLSSYFNDNNNNNFSDINELSNLGNAKQLTDITEENENQNDMPNVKKIMQDLKQNKTKVKNAIKKHFNSNENVNQDNNNFLASQMSGASGKDKNDLIMKIMAVPENINLLNQRLGNNFMEKLLNQNCSEDYIKEIDDILNEKNLETTKVPMRIVNKTRSKSAKKEKNTRLSSSFTLGTTRKYENPFKEGTSFENSLRDYPVSSKAKNTKKKFNNYMNPYGNYFTNTEKDDKVLSGTLCHCNSHKVIKVKK